LTGDRYNKVNLKGKDIQYIEAHGTGTPAGDPVEGDHSPSLHSNTNVLKPVGALGTVLGLSREREQSPLLIGSVKSNIGHLEGGSGLVGMFSFFASQPF
jgi:acyl transferase domain-containing protein